MAPQSQFLALAVFLDSRKAAYVRSIHVHEQNVGTLYTIQQEFLLNPGVYTRISQPMITASFRAYMSATGMKQFMAAIIRMQESDGWQCVLEYRSDCPSETAMPELLTPSRNGDLKNIPSLEQDLILVERAVSNYNGHMLSNDQTNIDGPHREGKNMFMKNSSLNFPSLTLCTSEQPFSESSNEIPGLETPERTPQGQQCDIWHKWGSDLELASPKISQGRFSHPSQETLNSSSPVCSQNATDPSSLWNPTSLLDLNLHLVDLPSEQNETDCALPLSNPGSETSSTLLNLELGTSSLSLQQSIITEEGMDCFSLECFGLDSSTCYSNAILYPKKESPKDMVKQSTTSLCSEESIGNGSAGGRGIQDGVQCSLMGLSPSEVNGNSSTTSGDMYSGARLNNMVGINGGKVHPPTVATSTDCSWREEGRVGSRRACSSSTLRQKQHPSNASTNKPPIVRTTNTSERITEITLQELSQYFHMPITQASKELKVGLTVLKKRCREFGIPRWPHRKMKSLESLIHNIQDLAKDQGVKSSSRVLNAVKELEEQKRLMEEMPGTELAERTKRLRQACFKANYKKRRLGFSTKPLPANHSLILDLNPTLIPSPNHIDLL